MTMATLQRRHFLQGCCAGIIAMSGARLTNVVFADSPRGGRDIVISLYLRGGQDGLSFVSPYADGDYHTARPVLGLNPADVLDLNGYFGLHRNASRLKELYDAQHCALIVAAGSTDPSRSHFQAQDYMDRGKPGDRTFATGWLARHLNLLPGDSVFKGISQGSSVSVQLEGFTGAVALSSGNGFKVDGDGGNEDDLRRALRRMYNSDSVLGPVVNRTLDAGDIVDALNLGNYTPTAGVTYPGTGLGSSMSAVAQLIRADLGLQAATVDLGGWDTHESQADNGNPANGQYASLITQLSEALHAFWMDTVNFRDNLTVVVMSEFGRRLRENDNRGTDHGHGGVMMVLNSHLAQKKVWGSWPGLGFGQLFEGVDVPVTTDFRTVLSEIMIARCGQWDLQTLFPGFTYPGPIGLFGTAGNPPAQPTGFRVR